MPSDFPLYTTLPRELLPRPWWPLCCPIWWSILSLHPTPPPGIVGCGWCLLPPETLTATSRHYTSPDFHLLLWLLPFNLLHWLLFIHPYRSLFSACGTLVLTVAMLLPHPPATAPVPCYLSYSYSLQGNLLTLLPPHIPAGLQVVKVTARSCVLHQLSGLS